MFKKEEQKKASAASEKSQDGVKKPEDAVLESAAETAEASDGSAETVISEDQAIGISAKPEVLQPAEPDWKALYALTLADFDNYKKRAVRDREDSYRYAESDILKDVLPAVDNLSLALASAGDDKKDDPFVKGVRLVYDTLLKSLKDHGAEPFDSVGLELDPERMEAIATLPNAEIGEGLVSIESKKGWMLKDKVLRAAQVVVSSGKPDETK